MSRPVPYAYALTGFPLHDIAVIQYQCQRLWDGWTVRNPLQLLMPIKQDFLLIPVQMILRRDKLSVFEKKKEEAFKFIAISTCTTNILHRTS